MESFCLSELESSLELAEFKSEEPPPALVPALNSLLARLFLPLEIESPYDLTPSLLLAILESLLSARLPIAPAVRRSKSARAKVQAMKVFLGVLEHDVLQQDVGLSDVDPRRLAQGAWEEVVFVGELLCWLARRRGIDGTENAEEDAEEAPPLMQRTASASPASVRRCVSPSHSTVTSGVHTELSMQPTAPIPSDTSVASTSALSGSLLGLREASPPRTPRCIHEVEDPSVLFLSHSSGVHDDRPLDPIVLEESFCHCADDLLQDYPSPPSLVRREGWIRPVDMQTELEEFENRRSKSGAYSSRKSGSARSEGYPRDRDLMLRTPSPDARPPSRRTECRPPPTQTLALLLERASLLEDIALEKAHSTGRSGIHLR